MECITGSRTLDIAGDRFELAMMVKISLRLTKEILRRFHHLISSSQLTEATIQFTRIRTSVSKSLSQTGHLVEKRSIPRLSKFTLVGILLYFILHDDILTSIGTNLFLYHVHTESLIIYKVYKTLSHGLTIQV